jgi:RHS repeat-associated protein
VIADAENRLASVTQGGVTTTFAYDGHGNRVKVAVGNVVTAYVGSTYEINPATGVTTTYYYAGGQRVAMRAATGPTWLTGDHLGSASLATNAAGAKVSDERYLPYGATRSGGVPTDYQFTGQRLDTGTGLYYYGARYYDPVVGRFISADVVVQAPGRPQTLNRYSYALNNPLRYTDPTGNVAEEEAEEAETLLQTLARLYGIDIARDFGKLPTMEGYLWQVGAWTLAELQKVQTVAAQLAGAMGGADAFKQTVGGFRVVRGEGNYGSLHRVQLDHRGFDEWTAAHEMAHAWDANSLLSYSFQLARRTGSYYYANWNEDTRGFEIRYHVGGIPPKGADGAFNSLEDMAESVAAFLYPGMAQSVLATTYADKPEYQYANYYETQRGLIVAGWFTSRRR